MKDGQPKDLKDEVAEKIRTFISEECEVDLSEVSNDAKIIDDLGADSLLFLELIEELKAIYKIEIEIRAIGRYLVKNPIDTVGELIDLVALIVEKGPEVLEAT